MKKFSITVLTLATALAIAPAARADSWTFNITGGGINANGVITFTPTATPGVDAITGITGFFSDSNGGYSGQITGLYSDPGNAQIIDSAYLFSLDQLFYPGYSTTSSNSAECFWGICASGTQLDAAGLDFFVAGGYEVGISADGSTYVLDSIFDGQNAYLDNGNNGVSVDFVAAPEPSSLLLLGTGLLGLAFLVFRKGKSSKSAEVPELALTA